jgi:O-succinylbenzoic acid--CoA ligase
MGDDLAGRFPIAMDESLLALAQKDDWAAAIPERVRAFILKPSQCPSFEKLGAICRFARDRGIALVASSALDTDVGIASWFPAVRAWFHHRGQLPAVGLDPLRWFHHGLALTAPVVGPVLSADSFRLAGMRPRETALRSIHPAMDDGRQPIANGSGTVEKVGDGVSLPSPSVWLADGTHLDTPKVERQAEIYSHELSRLGVGLGDTVALLGRETPAALFLLLAVWRLGAVACPLPRRLPPGTLSEMLGRLRPCLLVNDSEMEAAASSLPVRRASYKSDSAIDPPSLRLHASSPTGAPARDFPGNRLGSGENIAALLFTSGSSAQPKIAALSMAAFLANARAAAARIPLAPGDAWCANLPFNHVGGLSIIFRTALSGAALAFPSAEEPIPERATHLSLVSSQLVMLVRDARHRSRLASLKAVLLGGGPIPIGLCRELIAQSVPLFASYGLTETASQVATSPLQESDFVPGPPGVEALPGVEIRIGDRDEILVRSPSLFSGYLESQARGRSLDPSGFFLTGDRGRIGEDGKLQVMGRLDHLIISGGENIQPEEIERVLRQILPVSEAVVAGIPHPVWGQRPVAFLEWNEGAAIPPEAELKLLLRAHLPGFKIPDYFFPWPKEDGTRTPNGKVSRAFFSTLAKRLGEEASKAAEP